MAFSEPEKAALLSVKGVGPTVIVNGNVKLTH